MLKSTLIVSAMTFLSRVLGFVRDMVIARIFGADGMTDVFFVAFRIPNIFRRLFAEGAFAAGFVPTLAHYKENTSREQMMEYLQRTAGTLSGILLVLVTLGIVAAPLWILVFAPGFSIENERLTLAADMLRWTFPYLFFISLTAFAGSILNTFERFAVPAFTPVLLNVVLIGMALFSTKYFPHPEMTLAVGVFIAGLVQLAFQIPFLIQLKLLPKPKWGWAHEGVQKTFKLMLPVIFGASIHQVSLLLNTILASFLIAGSISWLYFADRLMEFPLGLFAIALATVILPTLSKDYAKGDEQGFHQTLNWGVHLSSLIALPAAVALFILASGILATLFGYGEFDQGDIQMTAFALMTYVLGLPAWMLVKTLAPAFFAREDTKTPVRIGVYAVVISMFVNIALVMPLYLNDIPQAHAALAFGTSVAGWINAIWLYRALIKQGIYHPPSTLRLHLGRTVIATAIMGGLLVWFNPSLSAWLSLDWLARTIEVIKLVILGGGCFALVLVVLGFRFKHLKKAHY